MERPNRMANDLMYRIIHEKPFNNSVISLLESSAITESEFKHSSYGKDYQLELSRTYINGMRNPDLVFELFGHFSLEPAYKVRKSMLNSVKDNMTEFKQCCKMALQLKSVTAEEWIKAMESPETPGDELCLYLLGRLYYRHSLVVNKYNIWCTVDTGLRTDNRQLFEWSCIKLLYLGNRTYGVLKPKGVVNTLPQPQYQHALNLTTTSNVNYARGYPRVRQIGRSQPVTRGRGRAQPTLMNFNQPYYTRGRYLNQMPRGLNRGLISARGQQPRPYTPPTSYWGGLDICNRRINASPVRPARPVDVVATVPGYAYSSQQWTTRNWQNLPPQPQPQQRSITSGQGMSPEVTSLLQSLNQRSNQSATPAECDNNPPIIVLDDEVPSEVLPSSVTISRNDDVDDVVNDQQQSTNPLTNTAEGEEISETVPQVTCEGSDSTEELLNEFGGATDARKSSPTLADVITGRDSDYETTYSKTTQILEDNNSTPNNNEHLNRERKELNLPDKPEVSSALKDDSFESASVGKVAGEVPAIKEENLNDCTKCTNSSDLTSSVKIKTETQEAVVKSEFIDYINKALLCKMEDTDMSLNIDKVIKSEDSDCNDASRVKTENDSNIETSDEQSSKPTIKQKHHTTAPVSRKRKLRKRPRNKRKSRKSPNSDSYKCTPLDRNIKATTKALFDQLKAIKQEVKREPSVVEDTLKDLDIPELNVAQRPSSILNPNSVPGPNKHPELEHQDDVHSNVEREQNTDSDVSTGNTEPINTKTDHSANDDEHGPNSSEWQKTDDSHNEDISKNNVEPTNIEGESELKTSCLKSKGKKRPQINSDSGESSSDVDILLQPRKQKKQKTDELPESDAELSTSATSEYDSDSPRNTASDSEADSVVAGSSSSLNNSTDDDTSLPTKKKESTEHHTSTSATSENSSDNSDESSPMASTSTGTSSRKRKSSRSKRSTSKTKTGSRKFKCPKCGQTEFSVQALNNHYRGTHGKLTYKKCKKQFNTPSSLKKHEYIHLDKPFKCRHCDKCYPFKSQLSSHEITHTNQQDYKCNITRCNKTFKRKNEYDMHMRVHDGIEHKCDHPGCTYSNYDECNLIAHQKVHKPEIKRYTCTYCGENFLHYTQRSRHIQRECTKAPQES